MEKLQNQNQLPTSQTIATEVDRLFREFGTDDNTTAKQLTLGNGKMHLTVSFKGEQPPDQDNRDIVGLINIVGPIFAGSNIEGNLRVMVDRLEARAANLEEDTTIEVSYGSDDWVALLERLNTWEPTRQARRAA